MRVYKTKDDEREIVPDGGTVRVSILAMDSTQKQIATIDERVQHNIDANKAVLAAARRNADWAPSKPVMTRVTKLIYSPPNLPNRSTT